MSGGKISSEEKMKAVERLKAEEYNTVGPNLYKFYKKLSRINTIQGIQLRQVWQMPYLCGFPRK